MSAITRIHCLLFMPLVAIVLTANSLPAAGNRETPTVQAVRKAMPSVVNIATETIVEVRDTFSDLFGNFYGYSRRGGPSQTTKSLGSGVIIDEEGYLLTNEHVVRRADRIWVKVDGAEYPATYIAGDATVDVALVKINAPEGTKFAAAQFAGDDDLILGESVLALGNPYGLGGSVSSGILSSKSRRQPLENQPLDLRDWLQTDAAINPGNSGGPLINLDGELIGLNVAVHMEGQGIGFAIPIRRVRESLSTFLSPESTRALWFG
ncbi:MAG: trypsin-like peptidase domain-containing protein, partial [Limisphaerales bacterium]